jgi:hypothetical protein
MAKPKTKTPTVTTNSPTWTGDQIKLRAFAGAKALFVFHEHLVATDTRLKAAETAKLTEATQAYRVVMREDYESPPSDEVKVIHFDEACAGLATHDAILEANKLARSNRAAERKRVDNALRELMTPTGDDAQMSLPITSDSTGLGLYTDDARAVVYTALLELDKTGALDQDQRDLMVDLAGAGIETIAFVLDAAEAIEEPAEDAGVEQHRAELDRMAGQANELPI